MVVKTSGFWDSTQIGVKHTSLDAYPVLLEINPPNSQTFLFSAQLIKNITEKTFRKFR
jgi:hypothetical protein